MGFPVYCYSFSKRENSTARPAAGSGREFSCVIRTESGVINPTIEIDLAITENPSQYNYAYIPNFNRYYFIDEWKFAGRLWIATLSVDVLATYKTEIGNHDLYVLRASAEYDGRVVDNLYPTKVNSIFDKDELAIPWLNIEEGFFVLGCVGKNPKYGSINYYLLNSAAFSALIKGLLDDTIEEEYGFDADFINEVGRGTVLSLVDPLQYIKSAMFFPIDSSLVHLWPTLNGIDVFNYNISMDGVTGALYGIIQGGDTSDTMLKAIVKQSFNLDILKHPQTTARGDYVNTAPYTTAQLIFPPFGTIELDTTVICNTNQITVEIRTDLISGIGIMEVFANGITLNKIETQIGVPMQLAQVTRDYLGAFNNVMSAGANIANAIGSGVTGNVAGAFAGGFSAAGAIGNAVASLIPRAQSIGSGGSFAQLYEKPRTEFQFFIAVDDDLSHNGRPLCKMKKPSAIPGYMIIQDGDVPTTATATENRKIRNYLESGFYFE